MADLLGVDVVINPRVLVAQELAKIARSHGASDVVEALERGQALLLGGAEVPAARAVRIRDAVRASPVVRDGVPET